MAIDTDNKRKSVLNFSIPGAFLLPIPDGTIGADNRRQMTESYAIPAITVSRSGWIKDQVSTELWLDDSNVSNAWVQDSVSTETWVPDQEIGES